MRPKTVVLARSWGACKSQQAHSPHLVRWLARRVFFFMMFQFFKGRIVFFGGVSPWNCFFNVINTSVTPCLRMGAAWIHADLGRLFAKLGPKGTKAGAVVMSDGIVEFCLDFEMATNCWCVLLGEFGDRSFQTLVSHGHSRRCCLHVFYLNLHPAYGKCHDIGW